MDPIHSDEFDTACLQIALRATFDQDFVKQLNARPRAVLADFGLETPAEATVELGWSPYLEWEIEAQRDAWRLGERTGRYTIILPAARPAGILLDEDLSDLAGGRSTDMVSVAPGGRR